MTISDRALQAQNSISEQELRGLATDRSPQVRRQVAANPRTPVDVLAGLAGDTDWRTRAATAARSDVPALVAIPLIEDKSWQVRFALADNQHSDPAVWRAIAQAKRTDIRMVFAQNFWIPEDVAEIMCADPATDVRQSLAGSTPHRPVLERLLGDNHQDVRANALMNPDITERDVVAAAHDRDHVVRAAAARSPLLPAGDRSRLLDDRSSFVRDEAAGPRWPPHTRHPESAAGTDDGVPDLTDPQVLASWPTTPSKPRTKWLKLFPHYRPHQDEVPDHVVWFWRYSERIDRDPAWIAWWAASPASKLSIGVRPMPRSRDELEQRDKTVFVNAGSPEAFALLVEPDTADFRDNDPEFTQRIVDLLLPALENALARAGQELDLGPPPPLPPRP